MKNKFNKMLTLMLGGIMVFSISACGTTNSSTTLNKVDLSKYSIVYSSQNSIYKTIAEDLAKSIEEKCKLTLSCVSDEVQDTGNEILVGNTNRPTNVTCDNGKYVIAQEGDSVVLSSDTTSGIMAASKKIVKDLKKGSVDYSNTVSDTYTDLSIKIMSYNIRMSSEDRWDRLENVITRNDPDLLGVQEVATYWQPKFKNDLSGYSYIGKGRGDSTDEAGYILYKTDKFDVVDSGTRWYSSSPTNPSKLADSTYNRIYTYATLKRKADNMEFLYINTHLDLNQTARLKSAEMLQDFIVDYAPDLPVYITGDFNTGYNYSYKNWVWEELTVNDYDVDDYLPEKGYSNSRLEAVKTDNHYTYPTNLYPGDASEQQTIIDYCFVKNNIFVESYKVDTKEPENFKEINGFGKDASDHYPIVIQTTLY